MVGSMALGYLLDSSFKSRRKRGFVGIGVVAAMSMVIWAGWLLYQLWYNNDGELGEGLDFKMLKFAGEFMLYINHGLLDAMFQSLCYWLIGALADDTETLSSLMIKLEKADAAFCFTSGLAALGTIIKLVQPGQEIVTVEDIYGGSDKSFKWLHLKEL